MIAPNESAPTRTAALNRALNVIGDRWTLMLLHDAFLGVRAFNAFQERLEIPRQTLVNRLRDLVADDIFYTVPYSQRPLRKAYRLSATARELYPFVLMIWRWQRRWNPGSNWRLPVTLHHTTCGSETWPRFACRQCGSDVVPDEVRVEAGTAGGATLPSQRRGKRWLSSASPDLLDPAEWSRHAVNVISDRWSGLIIAALFAGPLAYEALRRELDIASNILSHRLKLLVESGFLDKLSLEADARRSVYALTEKSRDMYALTVTLEQWGDRRLREAGASPAVALHARCGHALDAIAACSRCARELLPRDVTFALPDRDGNSIVIPSVVEGPPRS
jgi:DNA-binding HxlR family transcriptional regulator